MKAVSLQSCIEDALLRLSMQYSCRALSVQRSLITVQCRLPNTRLNCVLDIDDGVLPQVRFLIRFPATIDAAWCGELVLFVNLFNTHRHRHPGYWNFDLYNRELTYCYNWITEAGGERFILNFVRLMNDCTGTYDTVYPEINGILSGLIDAEKAVSNYLRHTTVPLN
ncbi:MAG: hypothetical protein LWW91_05905 [Bacteroidales bacterium]|nr:hypothetical protein [Bacteroidales bacterium]OJX90084.1 MAG: hypothetical protein BGP01_00270 [Paludibacter sp. 47-17]